MTARQIAAILTMTMFLTFPAYAEPDRQGATYLSSVIIYSTDMSALADFYRNALELGEPATRLDNHIGFWLGDNYLGFEPVEALNANPGGPTVWFGVDDAEAAVARLVAAGARPEMAPARQDWGDIHASVRDPDGNLVGLIQRGAEE